MDKISGVYSRTNSYEQVTAPSSISDEFYYRFMPPDTNNLYGLTPGKTYTLSGSASHTAGELKFRSQYSTDGSSWVDLGDPSDLRIPVSDGSTFTPFSYTFTVPVGATGIYISLQNYDYTAGSLFRFKNMKLEKGSVATNWCLSQSELTTTTGSYRGVTLNDRGLTATAGNTTVAMNSNDGFLINNPKDASVENPGGQVFHVDTDGNLTMQGNITAGNISGVNLQGEYLTLSGSLKLTADSSAITSNDGSVVFNDYGISATSGPITVNINKDNPLLIQNKNNDIFKVDNQGNVAIKGDLSAGDNAPTSTISGINFTGDNLTLAGSLKVNGQILFANGNGTLDSTGINIKGGGLSITGPDGKSQTTYIRPDGTLSASGGTFSGSVTATKLILDSNTSSINMGGGVFKVDNIGNVTANSFTATHAKITRGTITGGSLSIGKMNNGNAIDPITTNSFTDQLSWQNIYQRQDPKQYTAIPATYWATAAGHTVTFKANYSVGNYLTTPILINNDDLRFGFRVHLFDKDNNETDVDVPIDTRDFYDNMTKTDSIIGAVQVPENTVQGSVYGYANIKAGSITLGGVELSHTNPDYEALPDAFSIDPTGHVTANSIDVGPGGTITGGTINGATIIAGNIDASSTINGATINGGRFSSTKRESAMDTYYPISNSVYTPSFLVNDDGTISVHTTFPRSFSLATGIDKSSDSETNVGPVFKVNEAFDRSTLAGSIGYGKGYDYPVPYLYGQQGGMPSYPVDTDELSIVWLNDVTKDILLKQSYCDNYRYTQIASVSGITSDYASKTGRIKINFGIVDSYGSYDVDTDSSSAGGVHDLILVLTTGPINEGDLYHIDPQMTYFNNMNNDIKIKMVSKKILSGATGHSYYNLYGELSTQDLGPADTYYLGVLQQGFVKSKNADSDRTWKIQIDDLDVVPDSTIESDQSYFMPRVGGAYRELAISPNGSIITQMSRGLVNYTSEYNADYITFSSSVTNHMPFWTTVNSDGIGFSIGDDSASQDGKGNNNGLLTRQCIYFSGSSNTDGISFDNYGNIHAQKDSFAWRIYDKSGNSEVDFNTDSKPITFNKRVSLHTGGESDITTTWVAASSLYNGAHLPAIGRSDWWNTGTQSGMIAIASGSMYYFSGSQYWHFNWGTPGTYSSWGTGSD